jgi:acetyl-CoA acetyltransferase
MNTQETTMKNNAVFLNSTEARENCGRRCVEQMGIPERVLVQCLSQGTTSGVVAVAVVVVAVAVVVVAVAVVVVVDHVVVVLDT